MDAEFDLTGLVKDVGRLIGIGEQMVKVGDKVDDAVNRITAIEASIQTKTNESDKFDSKKLFWFGVLIAAVSTVSSSIFSTILAYLLSKH